MVINSEYCFTITSPFHSDPVTISVSKSGLIYNARLYKYISNDKSYYKISMKVYVTKGDDR